MTDLDRKIAELLFDEEILARDRIKANKIDFAYYTSASTAKKLIQKREVWLRNATCMNDFNEMSHGLSSLTDAYNSTHANELKKSLDEIYSGFTKDFEQRLDSYQYTFRLRTYLTCVSEHSRSEDQTGRLSMWRAYGGGNGVAFIFDSSPFLSETNVINAFSFPVTYGGVSTLQDKLAGLADKIKANSNEILQLGQQKFRDLLFYKFAAMAMTTKHIGFQEEKEWRVIYSPIFGTSPVLKHEVEEIGGVPQPVYKLPLESYSGVDEYDISIPTILRQIIIGPSEYQNAIYDALVMLLQAAGTEDSENLVKISDVPLRA